MNFVNKSKKLHAGPNTLNRDSGTGSANGGWLGLLGRWFDIRHTSTGLNIALEAGREKVVPATIANVIALQLWSQPDVLEL